MNRANDFHDQLYLNLNLIAHERRQAQVRAVLAGQPRGDDALRADHVSSGKRSRLQGDELRQAQPRRNGIAPLGRPRSHHHQEGSSFR